MTGSSNPDTAHNEILTQHSHRSSMLKRIVRYGSPLLLMLLSFSTLRSQSTVRYNNQPLFLNGANLAWMSFANDIGPGPRDFTAFGDILLQMHNHGGNTLRWWLHTNGTNSPAFNDTGLVIGPGSGTIESLRKALDIAWEREIGVILCLWSFDMLRATNPSAVVARNLKLLTDTTYIRAYIGNCLIPMVDSLKGHPAIIAWEIFNEPEGMSSEFFFNRDDPHVPMSAIQRFVNLCAGALHRTERTALVTNGTWSFKALTDVSIGSLSKLGAGTHVAGQAERQEMLRTFNKKYGFTFIPSDFDDYLQRIALRDNYNYYSDDRLIAEGGDADGTLDFYSVHYYDWGGVPISPLHHSSGTWLLDKAIVVAEFALKDTYGVLKEDIYKTLFRHGYAGALAWSWTDTAFSAPEDMLAGMKSIWDNERGAVDVRGVGGDWANVVMTAPKSDSVFSAGATVTIEAAATIIDDGHVVRVEFFANDTLKVGERLNPPYGVTWNNPPSDFFTLTAVATGNLGHKSVSNKVRIQIGTPSTVRMEAEGAAKTGNMANMSVRSSQAASGGAYLELRTQSGTITWTLPSVPTAGTYEVSFGYRLPFDTPKTQFLNVNGVRLAEIVFDGPTTIWQEKKQSVPLVQGSNTIQLELSWGWMDLDYLSVPRSLTTSVRNNGLVLPLQFSLDQNYPNPFNPSTAISYQLTAVSLVKLSICDGLGREVITLVTGEQTPGHYSVRWDGRDNKGILVASGIYWYRLQAGSNVSTRKMVLVR